MPKIDLSRAVVYDTECWPNFFSIDLEELFSDVRATYIICPWQDDRQWIIQLFNAYQQQQTPMIGFNNLGYDIIMLDFLYHNPNATNAELYAKSKSIINQPVAQFRENIAVWKRFAPQIDLMKVHHFDNKAKMTSLKALQINMRANDVIESSLSFDDPITQEQANTIAIPYNIHDVKQTKQFALHSMKALELRIGMMETVAGDVLNFSDTKLGGKILEQELGDDLCYTITPRWDGDNYGKREPRQTYRNRIALNEIIFPYVRFDHPEFNRILSWMRAQTLSPEDIEDYESPAATKGVFAGVVAHVGGIDFAFGTGGIHGSVLKQRFVAGNGWHIDDVDVAALYPSIAIVNRLAPEHLGQRFVDEYAKLPIKRKEFQALYGKKSVPANSIKLAQNGTYGNSNSPFSVFYDPKFTMAITINGQLMLCMLAEKLMTVPTLQIIQINTDGITYRIHESMRWLAAQHCKEWEALTHLVLEFAEYSRMWIRDVNSYIAESLDGSLKIKGAYWCPDEGPTYAQSISEQQPPAWHKDLSAAVVQRAAVAAMTKGTDIETFIRSHRDPFDFMCRIKVNKSDRLELNGREIQRTSRYYIAANGGRLIKYSPPTGPAGTYKKSPKVSKADFERITAEIPPGTYDARIHTKNGSKHETRVTSIESGWNVCECNVASTFDFANVDYRYYVAEARKLIV